ncbi:VanW family protein [uncultured Clostridium sp.]|uniref:VanW family protein n=1 Tax=uncultured Clostridium sp. TaxID=59620 RepID=UPI00262B0590|nr:VanW family protein [uncultured Clostridium sp.]
MHNDDENQIFSINEENERLDKDRRNKKFAYIGLIIVITIIAILAAYFLSVKNNVDSWNNKIYTGVTIHGVDVGGKTKNEAKILIEDGLLETVDDKKITISAKGENTSIEYSKIKAKYKVDKAIDSAFEIGKDASLLKRNSYIKKGVSKDVEVEFGYDQKVIDEYIGKLNEQVKISPKDATLNINGGVIDIVKEEKGIEVDIKKANELIKKELDCDVDTMKENIDIPTKESSAKITEEILSEIDGKIGGSSTHFNGGDVSRTTNLIVATDNINGTVLLPGEEFSYNDIVGERTVERGFRSGAGFSGDEVVQTIGGGVCQVSTTLYQSIIKSGIKSTERYNHSMSVSYAQPSEDATVAWGYLDYKFKNIYDTPIYIEGMISNGQVIFNIYGDTDELNGNTYDLVGVPAGGSSNGYFITYKDGVEISRERISTDTYK